MNRSDPAVDPGDDGAATDSFSAQRIRALAVEHARAPASTLIAYVDADDERQYFRVRGQRLPIQAGAVLTLIHHGSDGVVGLVDHGNHKWHMTRIPVQQEDGPAPRVYAMAGGLLGIGLVLGWAVHAAAYVVGLAGLVWLGALLRQRDRVQGDHSRARGRFIDGFKDCVQRLKDAGESARASGKGAG